MLLLCGESVILPLQITFTNINEKIIKAKKNLGLIKHLSMLLPHKTLDLMYKALVRFPFRLL